MNKQAHTTPTGLRGRTAARRGPQRLALSLALAAALSPGLADASELYWIGGVTSNGYTGRWSDGRNWSTKTQPTDGDSLHFIGNLANIDDLGYKIYGSITFESGAGAFKLVSANNNIGLTGGIRNLSSNVQTMDFGTAGYVISADQVWDGGSKGMSIAGGKDQHASLTLQNKVSYKAPGDDAVGNSVGDGSVLLTVRASSSYATGGTALIGSNAGANGAVYVQGAGSSFAAGTDLVLGDVGTGLLQVEGGATASANALYFGRSGGSGTLNVTGAGSVFTTKTAVVTEGVMSVAQGGQFKASDGVKIADYAGVASTITVQDAGSQFQVANVLTVGASGTGQLNVLTGATASAGQLLVGDGGTVNLQGGSLVVKNASLATGGNFNFASGTLEYTTDAATGAGTMLGTASTLGAGSLLKADAGFQVLPGTSLTLLGGNAQAQSFLVGAQGSLSVGVGSTLTSASVVNQGSLQLNGGRINGALDNQGSMSGSGYIGGLAGFVNRSFLDQTGTLELNTGNAFNNGTWNMPGGTSLTLRDSTLYNYNTINIDSAKISAAGASGGSVLNTAGGTITGNGILQLPFQNDGRLIVQGGTFGVQYTLQNNGQVLLNSIDASLVGATINNPGRIEGLGQIANAITNTGTINAKGGTLTLSSTLTNSGIVAVSAGSALYLQQGMAPNAGKIQLSGGTLDTNGTGLTNAAAGTLSGYGDIRSGLLTNNGRVLLSGGVSAVYSDVLTSKGSQIILSGNSNTTFYGKVDVQTGAELRVSAGSVATFFDLVQQRTGAAFTGQGDTHFEGGLSVGASPGLGTDAGNVSFGEDNVYLAEIGGVTACTLACASDVGLKNSSYDKYQVAGTLSLGGTLKLTSWNGFVAQAGERFDLLDWGQVHGSFASIDASGLQLADGTRLDTSLLYVDGSITVVAVPEPATWALMLGGVSCLGWLQRRRQPRAGRFS